MLPRIGQVARCCLVIPIAYTSILGVLRQPVESALGPAVVVEHHVGDVAAPGGDSHVKGLLDQLAAHVVAQRVADDPPQTDIEDVGDIESALAVGI